MSEPPDECLFCRIVAREIPADVVHEDERTLAFRDISPQAPTHVLVVPKDHHRDALSLTAADPALLAAVLGTAQTVVDLEGLSGHRLVFNTGAEAGQTVFHVHLHVLGGRSLQWPPG